jgi:general L-amino acid transport system permease protein
MAAQPSTSTADQAQPPVRDTSPLVWLRTNLFPDWWNSLLTLVFGPLIVWTLWNMASWVLTSARWEIIVVNLTNLMVGIDFPRAQLWRLWVAGAILAVVLGLLIGITAAATRETAIAAGHDPDVPWQDNVRRLGPPLALLASIIVFVRTPTPVLLLGALGVVAAAAFQVGKRLPHERRKLVNLVVVVGVAAALVVLSSFGGVPRARWGGFLITAYFTVGALLLAFPIGIAVALGRRSSLPVVRWSMSVYVEFFRGAPLIALLFIGWLVLPFMLPPEWENITRISRALIIFVLFTSAYVAEIVRGGLQSIPRGQWEAAKALGLSPWKQTRLIILPQALRNVIPAMVGQAISLYKDTTLVLIIGLSDLLRVAQVITQQPEFLGQGLIIETLVFVSFLYWIPSYWLSRESQRLEARLGVGER